MASFDRSILPGGEGNITLTINTKGYQGEVRWDTSVSTNDPVMGRFKLWLRADVQVAIHVMPRYVSIFTPKETQMTRVVEIKAGLETPLTLEPLFFDLDGKVSYEIQEIHRGKVFHIVFTNDPGLEGSIQGLLALKTNYPESPEVRIPVRVRITGPQQQRGLPGPRTVP